MKKKLIIIAGLCVMENIDLTVKVAEKLKKITSKYPVEFIFKASFDKANRTSLNSFRGVGLYEGMYILGLIKYILGVKILTDVHTVEQANMIGEQSIVDIVQLPAFLCRQTDLVTALAKTGKTINIKKGQFLAPEDMEYIIEKIKLSGNKKIMLTERGTCFGYHDLVVDFRSFLKMKKFGYPVIFDATHSQQKPSADKGQSGGTTEFVIPMAKSAVACGVDGLFIEVHPNPDKAKSDRATSLNFKEVEKLLKEVTK